MMMKNVKLHIGCSSFATPTWKTLFYPEDLPKKNWFDFYCRNFNTYEFNGSFYKFPTSETFAPWYDRTPEDFKFSIKAPRIITHLKRMNNSQREIEDFYIACREGLKDKLSCILWQFPPSFHFNREKLSMIIESLNPDFHNVIEFRHETWWQEEVLIELEQHNLTFCNVNFPDLPTDIYGTHPFGYVRMHGNPELFHSQYTKEEIEKLYDELNSQDFSEVFVYFNNTATTAGIINALSLKEIYTQN